MIQVDRLLFVMSALVALLYSSMFHARAGASEETFAQWLEAFQARAVEAGYAPDLVAETLSFDAPIDRVVELDRRQPEFVRPVWSYLESAVSASRIENGQARRAEEAQLLADIEEEWGVDPASLTAIWGLESAYGAVIGDFDVAHALATLAWEGRRRAFFETELLAILEILKTGAARREDLVGGWAGAMGHTQFMPTTYLTYAVDYDGDGRKDVWTNRGDALASAARYLSRRGWRSGEPWGVEVALPDDFEFALSDGRTLPVEGWSLLQVERADGQAWSEADKERPAKLLLPAGAGGPAFLTFANFDVFLRYNAATSYALAAGLLGDRIDGGAALRSAWPTHERPLAFDEIKTMQRVLTQLGYHTRGVDGRVGPNTRSALRAWQRAHGLPADAFPTAALLERLNTQAASTAG